MKNTRNALLGLSALALSLSAQSYGQIIYTSGHIDVGIAYEDGEWEPHVHDEETDLEYEPNELMFFGSSSNPNFMITAPGSGPLGFLGASGDDVFIFPANEDPSLPFIGIAAEEIDQADFASSDITIELTGFSGPGDFFLYQVDQSLNVNLLFDTSDGLNDILTVGIGSHAHYNWAFTEEGVYNVTLTASGILNDGSSTFSMSAPATFQFGVNAVPEPSAFALGAGVIALAMASQRRRRAIDRKA